MADDPKTTQDDTDDPMRKLAADMGSEHADGTGAAHDHPGGSWVEPRYDAGMTEHQPAVGDLDADGGAAMSRSNDDEPTVGGAPIIGAPLSIPGQAITGKRFAGPEETLASRAEVAESKLPREGGAGHPEDPRRPD